MAYGTVTGWGDRRNYCTTTTTKNSERLRLGTWKLGSRFWEDAGSGLLAAGWGGVLGGWAVFVDIDVLRLLNCLVFVVVVV